MMHSLLVLLTSKSVLYGITGKEMKKPNNSKTAKPVAPINVTALASQPAELANEVPIKETDRIILQDLNDTLIGMKLELANQTVMILQAEEKQRAVAQKIMEHGQAFFEKIQSIAKSYGIDLNQNCEFDQGNMKFIRR
jgi:hypothetical protein